MHADILAAQKGDMQAFKRLYAEHLARVYSICFRLCADKSQAEDATQEVFIQLWKSIAKFQGNSQFTTWLYSLASKVTISYLRRQKNWWQKMFSIEHSDIEAKFAEDVPDLVKLEKVLIKLPERARWVFVLHAVEGYRHEQIAKLLDIAEGTSKAQFHRARQLVEEYLGNDH